MNGSQTKRSPIAPISAHPAFTPLIAIWLAALLGGIVAVLPPVLFASGAEPADFAMSQITLAAFAAVFGAGLGWLSAEIFTAFQSKTGRNQIGDAELAIDTTEQPDVIDAPVEETEPELIVEPITEDPFKQSLDEIEPDTVEEPATLAEPADSQDDPFYADIVLSELLGAPKSESPVAHTEAHEPWQPAEEEAEVAAVPLHTVDMASEPAQSEPDQPSPDFLPDEAAGAAQETAPQLPQHGKAVNLLRTQATQELAMPQLIERLAVALDDQRLIADQALHSYSPPAPPADLAKRLRDLKQVPSRAA